MIDRATFARELIQRDRNVMQKTERVAAARLLTETSGLNAVDRAYASTEYALRQNDLEAALVERADWIADYAEEIRPTRGGITIRLVIANLDELRAILAEHVAQVSSGDSK